MPGRTGKRASRPGNCIVCNQPITDATFLRHAKADTHTGCVKGPQTTPSAQTKIEMRVTLLIDALKKIRAMGYDSQAARATDTVLACIRVAEEAPLEADR